MGYNGGVITVRFLSAEGKVETHRLSAGETPKLPESATVWVDFEAPTDEENRLLSEFFHFHPLAVEDAVAHIHHPKLDDYQSYLFLIVHELEAELEGEEVVTREVDIFLGKTYLVTYHDAPIQSIQALAGTLEKNPAFLQKSPDFLLHFLLDRVVDSFLPMLDALEERTEAVEEEVLTRAPRKALDDILHLKRQLMNIRRFSVLQREVLRLLSSGEYALIHADLLMYYRDVYDHLVRISDLSESYRDILSSVLEGYLTTISNRLNEVMKVLTIIATIMMPLTLITGIYGMNFPNIPLINSPVGFWIVMGGMGVLTILMLIIFRRAGWW